MARFLIVRSTVVTLTPPDPATCMECGATVRDSENLQWRGTAQLLGDYVLRVAAPGGA